MRGSPPIAIGLLVFVAVSIGLFVWVGDYAEAYFQGQDFTSRFPEKTLFYTADDLRKLMKSDVRSNYASPILFPLDLIVMLALSISLATASRYLIREPYPVLARYALVLPATYLLTDLPRTAFSSGYFSAEIRRRQPPRFRS